MPTLLERLSATVHDPNCPLCADTIEAIAALEAAENALTKLRPIEYLEDDEIFMIDVALEAIRK